LVAGRLVAGPVDSAIQCLQAGEDFSSPAIERCPQIESALDSLVVDQSSQWPVYLTDDELLDLFLLADSYSDKAAKDRKLDATVLDTIVPELHRQEAKEEFPSLWDKISQWLNTAMNTLFPGLRESIGNWWNNLDILPAVDKETGRNIATFISLCVVIAVVVLVLILLRRVLENRANAGKPIADIESIMPIAPDWSTLDGLPLSERPRQLLVLLLTRLRNRHEKYSAALETLTHRQLVKQLKFAHSEQQRHFGDVVRLAELAAYGLWLPNADEYRQAADAAQKVGTDILLPAAPMP
jgi:hypothetical protein